MNDINHLISLLSDWLVDHIKGILIAAVIVAFTEVMNNWNLTNFDFKGKRPLNSVNLAWIRLGYSKEDKQQRLLEHTG